VIRGLAVHQWWVPAEIGRIATIVAYAVNPYSKLTGGPSGSTQGRPKNARTPEEAPMSIPHCLAHDRKDTVAVVVVEGLKAGTDMLGVVTHDNSDFRVTAIQDIPIGHKVALKDIAAGDTIWKYGQDMGKAVAPIKKGEHVHTHNVKTKRW
jgi:(2R)-sulfolactate sulfo-lyase subunit alpha